MTRCADRDNAPEARGLAMVDVTVRGAGILGLSIAWECLQRGASVQVIDPYGVASGASGGIVGALAPHVPENWNSKKAFQFESLMMADSFWTSVQAASGLSAGYARLGRVQPLPADAALDLALARGENARRLWQGKAGWHVLNERPSWAPDSTSGYWIFDDLSARINPHAACLALAEALRRLGASISTEGPDQGRVLWASGVHDLARISAVCNRSFGGAVKGQAALLQADRAEHPQVFAEALHFVPHEDGTLAIGSTSERDFSAATSTDAQLEALLNKAYAIFPALAGAPVIARWAGVRPRSRSRAPVLGRHPLLPEAFIANGGFKIGFGMAPKIAQVMADLMLLEQDHIPEAFRPEASF